MHRIGICGSSGVENKEQVLGVGTETYTYCQCHAPALYNVHTALDLEYHVRVPLSITLGKYDHCTGKLTYELRAALYEHLIMVLKKLTTCIHIGATKCVGHALRLAFFFLSFLPSFRPSFLFFFFNP